MRKNNFLKYGKVFLSSVLISTYSSIGAPLHGGYFQGNNQTTMNLSVKNDATSLESKLKSIGMDKNNIKNNLKVHSRNQIAMTSLDEKKKSEETFIPLKKVKSLPQRIFKKLKYLASAVACGIGYIFKNQFFSKKGEKKFAEIDNNPKPIETQTIQSTNVNTESSNSTFRNHSSFINYGPDDDDDNNEDPRPPRFLPSRSTNNSIPKSFTNDEDNEIKIPSEVNEEEGENNEENENRNHLSYYFVGRNGIGEIDRRANSLNTELLSETRLLNISAKSLTNNNVPNVFAHDDNENENINDQENVDPIGNNDNLNDQNNIFNNPFEDSHEEYNDANNDGLIPPKFLPSKSIDNSIPKFFTNDEDNEIKIPSEVNEEEGNNEENDYYFVGRNEIGERDRRVNSLNVKLLSETRLLNISAKSLRNNNAPNVFEYDDNENENINDQENVNPIGKNDNLNDQNNIVNTPFEDPHEETITPDETPAPTITSSSLLPDTK